MRMSDGDLPCEREKLRASARAALLWGYFSWLVVTR